MGFYLSCVMSKRALVKYLQSLDKEELETQILELYDKFKAVKTYYNFVFNPKEEKLIEEAKFKISKEYFPVNGRKPKARRSVAQKAIRHFQDLELDPLLLADLMLFNIEIALKFNAEKRTTREAFYKSILNSFREAVTFVEATGLNPTYSKRLSEILEEVEEQEWFNLEGFLIEVGDDKI